MSGILDGVKVVDMGHVVAVPAAGAILSDWGADVIKIEPLTGDMLRGLARFKIEGDKITLDTSVSWSFQLLNRNKKSLALNLKTNAGVKILQQLVKKADVFISNYETGALQKLHCDYPTLSKVNPAIVYGTLTGYGTEGPDREKRGFDFSAAWARTGAQYLIGEVGSPPPPQRGGMMDTVTAGHIVAGILAALLHKEKTGLGQKIEFSLYQTGVWILSGDIEAALNGTPLPQRDRTMSTNPIFNSYRTKDDRWVWLAMLQSEISWGDFCRAIERPELEKDVKFKNMEARGLNCKELVKIIDGIIASRTYSEWEKRFKDNNCIFEKVQTPTEVANDPQAIANNFFADINIHGVAEGKLLNSPVKFHQNPASIKSPAPEIGQHSEEVLLELGYSWEDIAGLKEQKVIL